MSETQDQAGDQDLGVPKPQTASGIEIPELVTADRLKTPDLGRPRTSAEVIERFSPEWLDAGVAQAFDNLVEALR